MIFKHLVVHLSENYNPNGIIQQLREIDLIKSIVCASYELKKKSAKKPFDDPHVHLLVAYDTDKDFSANTTFGKKVQTEFKKLTNLSTNLKSGVYRNSDCHKHTISYISDAKVNQFKEMLVEVNHDSDVFKEFIALYPQEEYEGKVSTKDIELYEYKQFIDKHHSYSELQDIQNATIKWLINREFDTGKIVNQYQRFNKAIRLLSNVSKVFKKSYIRIQQEQFNNFLKY